MRRFSSLFTWIRTDFRCFRNRSPPAGRPFDREISCHAFYARYLETDRQVTGGLQGMLNRRQYLHARLLAIEQGGRVDPDGGDVARLLPISS